MKAPRWPTSLRWRLLALLFTAVLCTALAQATLADVEAHLQLLATQINADTRRHRALKELRDLALAAGATGDSPLLSAFGAAESVTTEVA